MSISIYIYKRKKQLFPLSLLFTPELFTPELLVHISRT